MTAAVIGPGGLLGHNPPMRRRQVVAAAGTRRCGHVSEPTTLGGQRFVCTRIHGHDGRRHYAGMGGNEVAASWPVAHEAAI